MPTGWPSMTVTGMIPPAVETGVLDLVGEALALAVVMAGATALSHSCLMLYWLMLGCQNDRRLAFAPGSPVSWHQSSVVRSIVTLTGSVTIIFPVCTPADA